MPPVQYYYDLIHLNLHLLHMNTSFDFQNECSGHLIILNVPNVAVYILVEYFYFIFLNC